MLIIPRSPNEIPEWGAWSPHLVDGKLTALLACPKCGARGTLESHAIDAAGRVTPSVMCAGLCDYHVSELHLQGWKLS